VPPAIYEFLFVVFAVGLSVVLVKGAYDIYIGGSKAYLRDKTLVKCGMPLIAIVLLICYLFGS